MIIKKFIGKNEEEAVKNAKAELGAATVIMNVRTIKRRGRAKLFRKPQTEVTAAVEEEKDTVCYDDILKNVQERDFIDSHREVAPLKQAEDALVLDNSDMTIPQQNAWLLEKSLERING